MPVRIYTTNTGTDLSDAEAALLADLVARHGRAVLLAPSFAELDLCRHDAAVADVSLGVDYKTPASWLRSLWEFMGDGRSFVDNMQRQMLFSDMIARRDDADLQPLSRSQGTVRMLARMARDVLPGVAGTGAERCCGDARYVCAVSRRLRTACSSCCRPWRTMGERSLCCLPASRRQCARNLLPPLMPAVCCLRPRRWGRVPLRPDCLRVRRSAYLCRGCRPSRPRPRLCGCNR